MMRGGAVGASAAAEDVAGGCPPLPLGGAVRAWRQQQEATSWSYLLPSVISRQEVGVGKKPSSPFPCPTRASQNHRKLAGKGMWERWERWLGPNVPEREGWAREGSNSWINSTKVVRSPGLSGSTPTSFSFFKFLKIFFKVHF